MPALRVLQRTTSHELSHAKPIWIRQRPMSGSAALI